jgi:CcmD family protein
MSETAWLFVAFAAVWVGIGIYLASIAGRQAKIERRLEQLEGDDNPE